jgi:hemolysin activation/secretion protein
MKVVLPAIFVGLLACCLPAAAQVVPPGDEAGRIEQRFEKPRNPQAKLALREGLEATVPPDEAEKILLRISNIRFEGNTALDDATLKRIAKRLQGKKVSLREVFDVAAEVTTAYGKAGYTLSRAIVPPQELEPSGASVTIRLIEGYIDQVQWPNELDRYWDLFSRYSESITAERPVRIKTIERYLLLANDLPGLKLSSRLVPSQINPAASTLVVTVEKEKHLSVAASFDNRGTEGSGPYQGQLQGTLSNVFGLHEELSLGYTLAGPKHHKRSPELKYLSMSYGQILSSEGLRFDLSGNASWGEPGTPDLLLLEYETKSLNVSGQVSYPFIRTRDTNLTGVVAMDWKNSESSIFGVPENDDRLRIVRAEVAYDHADAQRGINQLFLSVSQGIDGLGSTENGNPLASRANGKVDFLKVNARASRLQNFDGGFSGLLSLSGQLSADPLLSSQECGFGGSTMGRGFDPSVVSGDHCLMALAELRYDAETGRSGLDKFQPYAFADFGSVWNIDVPAGTPEQDNAASVGAGLRFGWKYFEADLQVSYQVDRPKSVTVDDRIGVFFDLSARF